MTQDQCSQDDKYKLFVQLFTRHARKIFSYVLTLVGNYDHAEEVFQETSGTLWEKFGEFEPGTNFGAWACRIAYYKALNYRTKQRKSPTLFSDTLLDSLDQQIAAVEPEADARDRALSECCERLTVEDRQIIEWRYSAGKSAPQIGKLLGQSQATVYRSLARIHNKLMACIENRLLERET